ncbi:MAG: diacylglycerol kinase family protein [Actinomycetota bacterium]
MSSPYGKAVVVMGPTLAGKMPMTEPELDALLQSSEIDYETVVAAEDAHTAAAARKAVSGGCGYVVCVGDDWTLHQVINGIMGESGPLNPGLVLAVLPTAAGSDFLRTFGLSSAPQDAARRLASEPYFGIDVGRITWAPGTSPGYTYFVNMAQAGVWGEVARRRARLMWLGRTGHLLAFWAALAGFGTTSGAVKVDRRSYGGPIANVVVANGQFFRDGVRLAVKAHPGDGKFDVLVQKGGKRDFIETLSKSFKTEHLPSSKIKEFLGARAEIASEKPLPVETDGRFAGHTPAIFEIVPQACRLKI